MTPAGTAEKIAAALKKYNLPIEAGVEKALLLDTMAKDKKKSGNTITLIVLDEMGKGRLHKINWQEVPNYLG
jgi:3-dehydroquinate synthase